MNYHTIRGVQGQTLPSETSGQKVDEEGVRVLTSFSMMSTLKLKHMKET